MTPTQRATDIKGKLDSLEEAVYDLNPGVKPDLVKARMQPLHDSLAAGLTEQGTALGIAANDQAVLSGGGTPKTRGGA